MLPRMWMRWLRKGGEGSSVVSVCRGLASKGSRGEQYEGTVGDFHINPYGNSDVIRTRLSLVSTEMLESKLVGVLTMSCYGFRLMDKTFVWGPVALFPKTALSWRVRTPDDITPESLCLFTMLEPKLDVLVIGAGDRANVDKVRANIAPSLNKLRIGLEIMNTEDAVGTFNFLNAENRYVAAGLYPPDDLIVNEAQYAEAMSLLEEADFLQENVIAHGKFIPDEAEDVIQRLWDERGRTPIEKIRKMIQRPEVKGLRGPEETKKLK